METVIDAKKQLFFPKFFPAKKTPEKAEEIGNE